MTSDRPDPAGDSLDLVFSALADPTRRHLMERLTTGGPATSTQLASALPITRQAVAKHLLLLDCAGLVTRRRVGRETRYAAATVPLTQVIAWLSRVGAEWDQRLAALSEVVED